jgi:hypothetical protein
MAFDRLNADIVASMKRGLEIRRLRSFVRATEDGSLTKAAGILRVAQPAWLIRPDILLRHAGNWP